MGRGVGDVQLLRTVLESKCITTAAWPGVSGTWNHQGVPWGWTSRTAVGTWNGRTPGETIEKAFLRKWHLVWNVNNESYLAKWHIFKVGGTTCTKNLEVREWIIHWCNCSLKFIGSSLSPSCWGVEGEPCLVSMWLLLSTGRCERGHESLSKLNFLLVYKWLTTAINRVIVQVTTSFGTTVRWCPGRGLMITGMHSGWPDSRPHALSSGTINGKGLLPVVAFHPSPH